MSAFCHINQLKVPEKSFETEFKKMWSYHKKITLGEKNILTQTICRHGFVFYLLN